MSQIASFAIEQTAASPFCYRLYRNIYTRALLVALLYLFQHILFLFLFCFVLLCFVCFWDNHIY